MLYNLLLQNMVCFIYEGHPESKECLCIQSMYLFCCSWSLVSGVQCDAVNCLMQLYVRSCHVVSAQIAVAMAEPIENPTDCEVRSVIHFLQVDEILPKRQALARNSSVAWQCTSVHCQADVLLHEQFHWDIFKHPPYSLNLAPSEFFPFSKNEGVLCW